jgi:hypothetical protein
VNLIDGEKGNYRTASAMTVDGVITQFLASHAFDAGL